MNKKYLLIEYKYKVYSNKSLLSSKEFSVIELLGKSLVDNEERYIFNDSKGNILILAEESVKKMLTTKYAILDDIGSPERELKEITLVHYNLERLAK